MLSTIIFKALLKISKENTDNNYIYSDIDFPKTFIKLKTKRDKQDKLINYKNIFISDKYYSQRRSQNISKNNSPKLLKRRKLIINNNNEKNENNENNEALLQKKTIINKNEKGSSLPHVNNFSSHKNSNHIKKVKFNISKNNFNSTNKNGTLQLTPKKKNNIFDRNPDKKTINNYNINPNWIESNSAINIHVLKINAPKDEIKKDILSISRNILSQKKFFDDKNRIINNLLAINAANKRGIQLRYRDRNKERQGFIQKLHKRIAKEKKKNSQKNNADNLSFSLPKPYMMKHFRPKVLTMMKLNAFKEKYIAIEDIDNIVDKEREIFPLHKKISSKNYDLYYYSINRMYANQIREYMKHRINWVYVSDRSDLKYITINFSWRYSSSRVYYKKYKYDPSLFKGCNSNGIKKLKMINLFERNYEVGNKKYMFLNLINYCDKINLNVFDIVPFTIIINNTPDLEFGLEALNEVVLFVSSKWEQNSDLITNRKYSEHFWFDKNYDNIKNQIIYINKNFLSEKNYWIVKPTDLYQGKCINIFTTFEQIYKQCKNIFRGIDKSTIPNAPIKDDKDDEDENDSEDNNNLDCDDSVNGTNRKKIFYSRMYCSNEIIIQKYLDSPLLYNNRKFDIRCFVLVDHHLNIYFFKEGHLKASSELYNINEDNRFIHITNYSLQKKCDKFETYEEGNEISYNDFKKFLLSQNISLDNFDNMINKMKYLVEISMKAVGKKLLKTSPVLSFEIFGYDFIIDNDFQPWILEINNNPGLVISSPVIQKIIPRMLDDAFRLTIDTIFDTRYDSECIDKNGKYKSKYSIDGYNDEENIFEFLCNIK